MQVVTHRISTLTWQIICSLSHRIRPSKISKNRTASHKIRAPLQKKFSHKAKALHISAFVLEVVYLSSNYSKDIFLSKLEVVRHLNQFNSLKLLKVAKI